MTALKFLFPFKTSSSGVQNILFYFYVRYSDSVNVFFLEGRVGECLFGVSNFNNIRLKGCLFELLI